MKTAAIRLPSSLKRSAYKESWTTVAFYICESLHTLPNKLHTSSNILQMQPNNATDALTSWKLVKQLILSLL